MFKRAGMNNEGTSSFHVFKDDSKQLLQLIISIHPILYFFTPLFFKMNPQGVKAKQLGMQITIFSIN